MIRRDGDRLYVETILPEADKQAGCFSLADLKKQGEGYSGNLKFSCVCQYRSGLKANRYSMEIPLEISKIGPTRIEGWVMDPPKDAKFDCAKGTYSKPLVRQAFVWIPQ